MIFKETPLKDAWILDLDKREDARGFFARSFCLNELREKGIQMPIVQANVSMTRHKGTLRGMHYQIDGAEEAKLVRCTKGKILDVIIDLRPESPSFEQHFKVELSSENYRQIYIPEGFAHGFLTLSDDVEMQYFVSNYYSPGKERGIRWNDPHFGIDWPVASPMLSEKDAAYPDYRK